VPQEGGGTGGSWVGVVGVSGAGEEGLGEGLGGRGGYVGGFGGD